MALPPDATNPTHQTTQFIDQRNTENVGAPNLPATTQFNPQLLQEQGGEQMTTQGLQGDVNAQVTQAQGAAPVEAQQTTAQAYQASLAGQGAQGTAAQMDPNTAGTAEAAQGEVDPRSLIQNQYKELYETDENNDGVPDFAQPTKRSIDEQMAARGLGASSIAAEATAFGVMQSLFPMAQFNANLYSEMNKINLNNQQQANLQNAQQKFQAQMANLSAEQQTNMQNLNNRQQTLLTDQAAENASRQFNAQSEQQNQQFMSSLLSSIAQSNAQRADSLAAFNAGQANALEQFNAQLKDARQKFNVENQRIVDQSNVEWRRNINTANTAAINAANQVNVQNQFNLSAQAQANLWQQWRDEASWANQASENERTRAHNLAVAAIQRDSYFQGVDQANTGALYAELGQFGLNVLSGVFSGG
jgi:hypothetical protein